MTANTLVEASPATPSWETVPPRHRSVRDWRSLVLDAYARQPTLSLTTRQGQRLWGVDSPTCREVLDDLVDAGVLARTTDGQYCRLDHVARVEVIGLP